jgi:hypothetical protein
MGKNLTHLWLENLPSFDWEENFCIEFGLFCPRLKILNVSGNPKFSENATEAILKNTVKIQR